MVLRGSDCAKIHVFYLIPLRFLSIRAFRLIVAKKFIRPVELSCFKHHIRLRQGELDCLPLLMQIIFNSQKEIKNTTRSSWTVPRTSTSTVSPAATRSSGPLSRVTESWPRATSTLPISGRPELSESTFFCFVLSDSYSFLGILGFD